MNIKQGTLEDISSDSNPYWAAWLIGRWIKTNRPSEFHGMVDRLIKSINSGVEDAGVPIEWFNREIK